VTALPLIDARTSRMALHDLLLPPDQVRSTARTLGQLWAVISLRAMAPFPNATAECVTFLVLNSTDDEKVAEFFNLAKTQAMTTAAQLFEIVGQKHEVAKHVFAMATRMDPKIAEITVRMVDDLMV
jgi:hypothetical protein